MAKSWQLVKSSLIKAFVIEKLAGKKSRLATAAERCKKFLMLLLLEALFRCCLIGGARPLLFGGAD